jgi:hypothetical protein
MAYPSRWGSGQAQPIALNSRAKVCGMDTERTPQQREDAADIEVIVKAAKKNGHNKSMPKST